MEIGQNPASSCSKEHQKIYQEWFALADSDGDGRITGPDAIKFFGMSKLSRPDLKQVWAIADSRRQGYLGFPKFVAAMQLVSLAQAGNEITQDSLKRDDLSSLNPPVMEGLDALLAVMYYVLTIVYLSLLCFIAMLCTNMVVIRFQKSKYVVKRVDPEIDGFPQEQSPITNKWFSSKSSKKIPLTAVTSVIDGLKKLYIEKLKPLEVTYKFNDFSSPLLTSSDFDAKPMVMLLGQYSIGKTTFIKHL